MSFFNRIILNASCAFTTVILVAACEQDQPATSSEQTQTVTAQQEAQPASTLKPTSSASTNLYWGDTHLHTNYSGDAYSLLTTTADPDTSYRFAKGLPVIADLSRKRVQIETPLDFLVVTDHAEFMSSAYRSRSQANMA